MRGAAGLVIGFGGALGIIQAVDWFDQREPDTIVLGALDFDGYCGRDEGLTALLLASDPYGWRCIGTIGGAWTRRDIDPDEVCHWQYDDPTATAVLVNPADVNGWSCVTP